MENRPQQAVHISHRYRWIENAHIFLWLIKDTCWALEYEPGGIFMIFPTVTVALYLTWRSRKVRSELFHNIAVCFWILANSTWMLGEFVDHEARPYAVALFLTGLVFLIVYYLFFFRKDKETEKEYTLAVEEKKVTPPVSTLQ